MSIYNTSYLEPLKHSGKILASALSLSKHLLEPGITPLEIDLEIYQFILNQRAAPTFLGLGGYPNTTCISVNDQIVHAVPTRKPLKEGDLVTVDIGVKFYGYCTDAARTFIVGKSEDKIKHNLIKAVNKALDEGIKKAVAGGQVSDISYAIQKHIESKGFKSPLDYGGHGIGSLPHQDPYISNTGMKGRGKILIPWSFLAIEPIAMVGSIGVFTCANDGFTVCSSDGGLSSHAENTLIVTHHDPIVVTRKTLKGGLI